MRDESEKDYDPQKKHPYRFYWLTGGLAAILAAIIAAVVALSSAGPGNTSTSSGNTTGQDNGFPLGYRGTWQGIISYTDQPSYHVILQLSPGSPGQVIGQFTNTDTDCAWTVYLVQNGTPLQMHWVLNSSPPGSTCLSSAYATATLLNQTSLNVAETSDPNSGIVPRSGTLSRTSLVYMTGCLLGDVLRTMRTNILTSHAR
jgi:hypothetical protein